MKTLIKFGLSLTIILMSLLLLIIYMLMPPNIPVPPSEARKLANVAIYNPGEQIQTNQTIIIDNGIITDIRPSTPDEKNTLCENCFAMPGLIDAHVHTPPSIAIGNRELFSLLFLQHGVTTIRDLGQLDDDLPNLVKRLNTGKLVGPRMYYCGRILDGNPPSIPGAVLIENAEDGRRAVAEHAKQGVDCIKIYGNLSADAFTGVSNEANRLNLPLTGHTPRALSFHNIRNFESQHYTGIPYLSFPAPKGWAYKSQDLISMAPSYVDSVLEVMSSNNISFLPTNANNRSRLTVSDPDRFPASPGFRHMPNFWETTWPSIVSHPETDAEIETELEAAPVALAFIKKAHERGVDVLVGTDVIMPYVIPGESIHQQLELISKALESDEKALRAATFTNGQHIDSGKIGEISIGAYADMLLFKQDPRGNLAAIQNWDYALIGGRLYHREDIDNAVERYDRHFQGRIYNTVMNMAYRIVGTGYENSEVSKR